MFAGPNQHFLGTQTKKVSFGRSFVTPIPRTTVSPLGKLATKRFSRPKRFLPQLSSNQDVTDAIWEGIFFQLPSFNQ